jgi:hypothetical protein
MTDAKKPEASLSYLIVVSHAQMLARVKRRQKI